MFKKQYADISRVDLHELAETLLRNLYANKKNPSIIFRQSVDLVLRHPNTAILDRNVA